MSTAIPGLVSFPRPPRRVRASGFPLLPHGDVVIASGQVDSGNSAFRTSFLRPGCALVLRTSTGKYVMANDVNGDRNAGAVVTALITNPGAGAWDGTLTIKGHWGSLTVTLSADNTDAAVVTKINAAFDASTFPQGVAVASVLSTRVVVTNRDKGAGTYLQVAHGTVASGWGTVVTGTGAIGTDADYVVTETYVDMLNGAAAAADAAAQVTAAGHYDAANLINLTAEAYAVLAARGSQFTGTPTIVGGV